MKRIRIIFFLLFFATLCKGKDIAVADSDSIYLRPEILAEYEGGVLKMMKYISKKVYESGCAHPCPHIVVRFVVEKDGSISNVRVHYNSSGLDDSDLKTIIYEMPKWKCAVHNGEKVRSWNATPIYLHYYLTDEEIIIRTERKEDSIQKCRSAIKLRKIKIPKGITTISKHAFWRNEDLAEISIPNTVTAIDDGAFEDCKNLTTINLPKSVKKIGTNAFCNCEKLSQIVIPEKVEKFPAAMMFSCKNLTDVTIHDGIKTIGDDAFGRCEKLKRIIIPKGTRSKFEKLFEEKYHQFLTEDEGR